MKASFFFNEDTGEIHVLKGIMFIALLIVIIGALGFATKSLFFPGEVIKKAYLDADKALYTYEWFHKKYQSIKSAEMNLSEALDAHKRWRDDMGKPNSWGYAQHQENGRLNDNITGIQMHLNELVSDYNAKASMVTRKVFKSSSLPEHIDFIGKPKKGGS